MYTIHPIDRDWAEDLESLGAKPKFWFRSSSQERRTMFKADDRGTGEDWAEKISCELAALLGLPHVYYELAQEMKQGLTGNPGVICQSCVSDSQSLIHGNQLLFQRDPNYPADGKYRVSAHTIAAVSDALNTLQAPGAQWMQDVPAGITSALDVFVGYVMLDAWVANQDRHHLNWAAIQEADSLRLAPSFDHGASLARNVREQEKIDRLNTRDAGYSVARFANRAESAFFIGEQASNTMTTFAAHIAFAALAPAANALWLAKLASITDVHIEAIIEKIPNHRMSGVHKRFTLAMLKHNWACLLKEVLPISQPSLASQ